MKKNLPYLNQERLDFIFDHVYDDGTPMAQDGFEERILDLLIVLKSMQSFNCKQRPEDTRNLFGVCNHIFNFETNSEGTIMWLSLILAIKELYGFSEWRLLSVIEQVSIRK